MYFRRRFRCLKCSQVTNAAFISSKAILAIAFISVLVVLVPLVVRPRESHTVPVESVATIRFARAFKKVQTKYKALFVAFQLWCVILFTAPVELPRVTVGFLDYFRVLSAVIPGTCFTNRRYSHYTNLLVWTTAPFALVALCVVTNVIGNLVRSIKASLAASKRVDGHQQRPFVNLVYQNVFGITKVASRIRRLSRSDSRRIFSRRIADSQVALAVLVIVAFVFAAASRSSTHHFLNEFPFNYLTFLQELPADGLRRPQLFFDRHIR